MIQDRFLICCSLLHTWMVSAACYLFLLAFQEQASWVAFGKGLFFWLPIVFFYGASRFGKRIWSFLLVVALCIGLCFLLGNSFWEEFCLVAVTVVLAGFSFAGRVQRHPGALASPAYPHLLVFFGVYVYGYFYQQAVLSRVSLFLTACYWLLILWKQNRENYLSFYEESCHLYRFPGKRIASSNQMVLLLFSILTIGGMLVLPFSGLERVLFLLGEWLRRLLAYLLRGGDAELLIPEADNSGQMPAEFLFQEEGAVSPIWTALLEILDFLLQAALFIFLAVSLCRFFYSLYKRYNSSRSENGDILEALSALEKEKKEKLSVKKEKTSWFGKRSLEDQVRRYYRQQVKKRINGLPAAAKTPKELEEEAGIVQQEFHALYEKARYGKTSCTAAETVRMKELNQMLSLEEKRK